MAGAPEVRRLAIVVFAGQAVFALAWLVAGGLDRDYSHERQAVSELAARDADRAWIVALGVVALGLSWVALAPALRAVLPKRAWSWAPPALFLAAGVATILIALLPLDCADSVGDCRTRAEQWDLSWRHYAHWFVGWSVQLVLAATPFALALALRPGPLSRLALALGLLGLVLGAGQIAASFADEDRVGIYQRSGLVLVHGWTCLLAAAAVLASSLAPSRESSERRSPLSGI